MADCKCAGRVGEDMIEGKAPEKTGAVQKLRRFGCCIGHSVIFVGWWPSGEPENKPSPRPSPIRWERESERGGRCTQHGASRGAGLVLGYFRSSFQDFGLSRRGIGPRRRLKLMANWQIANGKADYEAGRHGVGPSRE